MASNKQETESSDVKVPFKRKQVRLAIKALLSHLSQKSDDQKKKDELFENDEHVWLILSVNKIPIIKKKPKKIPLPHSFNGCNDVCLITKEPGKVVKAALREKGVVSIKKVISLTKLRKEYKTFQLKRQLLSLFDVFLCDDRIYPLVLKTLGKVFFKRKREPIPVNLTYPNVNVEIQKSLSCTLLRMGHGPSSAIKIGSVKLQNEKELLANAIHAMKIIPNKVPGGWKNIKCFYLKTALSIALPLYQSLQFKPKRPSVKSSSKESSDDKSTNMVDKEEKEEEPKKKNVKRKKEEKTKQKSNKIKRKLSIK
ncbi:ribosomal L1 domain-containing protein 1 isoform X1 [Hydra vulgaris]|uniref:ribosomal L1 domain-containing protein 1 isoform X1 n=1 Tax=Hydra vulgaris TaxID=6087 RepID=UPI001F5F8768|nr:ribosomal L1 domain-containing protein 1 [Hydra vulgaris]